MGIIDDMLNGARGKTITLQDTTTVKLFSLADGDLVLRMGSENRKFSIDEFRKLLTAKRKDLNILGAGRTISLAAGGSITVSKDVDKLKVQYNTESRSLHEIDLSKLNRYAALLHLINQLENEP